MSEIINGVPIGDLPGIESVPDDSMMVVEFLGKAYHMPGAVLRQMIQDVLDSMGDSVDDVTEARLTAAIETVLASGKYNGVSPLVEVLDEEDGTSVIHIIDAFGVKKYPVEVKGARNAVQYVEQELTDEQKAQARKNIGVGDGTGTTDAVQYVPQTLTTEQQTQARNNIGISDYVSRISFIESPNPDFTSDHIIMVWNFNGSDDEYGRVDFNLPYSTYELARKQGYIKDETTFYKEMSSNLGNPKADSLQIDSDTGTLMLLSANEPIGDGVKIPVFVGKYDTVTFAEIKTAHDAGRVCFLDFNGISLPLLGVNDTEAMFVREINENTDYRVTITSDGGKDFTIVDKNISDVYVVSLFSAKYADIKAAYDAGKACFVTYGALLCPLTVLDEEKAEFVGMLTPHLGIKGTVPAEGNPDFTYVHSNAVQTVEQSLTDDQKAQARTNIGALSTGDVDTVLQQAKDSGQFDGKDGYTPVKGVDYFDGEDGYTPIKGVDYTDGKDGYTPVKGVDYFDGEDGKTAYAYAQDGGYTGTEAEFAAKLASGSEPLKVTLSGNDTDGYTADKTVAEIYAARNAGRDIYMVGGILTYQLCYLSSSFASFTYTRASGTALEVISVVMMDGAATVRFQQTIDDSYVKYTEQSLDEEYKLQARSNIGAAAAADIAATKYASTSTSSQSIFKISDFGSWGTGAWYQKGFSMLITSRAGETVWFSLSANDSATTARAFRLMNTYSKIAGVYYSVSENAVYVKANAWCNNVTAHILSNIGGDYVPTVASVSGLASDAVEVDIIEFGPTSSGLAVGDSSTPLLLGGSATRPTYNGADMALSSDLSSYLPLGGGLMTGPLKFQAASLPGKTLQYICGIDAFASGGEMGWQSKADFLSGYLTTTGTAARATADANGNNIANTYAKVTTANDYNGEQRFKNSAYCPTITDTASGIGCAFKSSRGLVNELLADKIIATASTGKIPFYSYTGASNGSMSGLTEFAYLSPGAFILRPPSGEGGQIQLEAAANDPTNTGICIDTAGGNFRIFGLQSADGTTTTGYGSVLAIHPYAKIITGGYSFDGLAAKATADGNGRNIVSTYATKDEVVTAANGSLKVTLSGTSVDKTLAQIETALNAGRHVYLVEGINVYQLSYHMDGMVAAFTSVLIPSADAQVSVRTVMVWNGMAPSVFTKTI